MRENDQPDQQTYFQNKTIVWGGGGVLVAFDSGLLPSRERTVDTREGSRPALLGVGGLSWLEAGGLAAANKRTMCGMPGGCEFTPGISAQRPLL